MKSLSGLVAVALMASPLTALAVDRYGILLLDRTGSMQVNRVTGHTRCYDSIVQAHDRVNAFYDTNRGTHLSIWQFDGASVTAYPGGFIPKVNRQQAHAIVDAIGPNNCNGGSTNLADAMCSAGKHLQDLNVGRAYLHVATDGYENSSIGPCAGPSGDPDVPGSWQYKVVEAMDVNFNVVVNTDYFVSSTPLELNATAPANSDVTFSIWASEQRPLPGPVSLATCTDTVQCEGRLFRLLASLSGGNYYIMQDGNSQFPCAGSQCPAPEPKW
ncbi:vWA domain-containing protein [Corallococcus llansteffanensis]|nr:vWA domain-containing protein [Corallococcus llansteffanensis]